MSKRLLLAVDTGMVPVVLTENQHRYNISEVTLIHQAHWEAYEAGTNYWRCCVQF